MANSDSDSILQQLIKRSQAIGETYIDGFITLRTIQIHFMDFTRPALELGVRPVQEIVSVEYVDTNGDTQTLTEGQDFYLDKFTSNPSLVSTSSWPSVQSNNPTAVTIQLKVGYLEDQVPEDIKHAILLKVGELFEHREESLVGASATTLNNTMRSLLNPHRRLGI